MSLPSFDLIGLQTTELLQGFCFQGLRSLFSDPGTESMGKPWKNHGKSMGKIPWIPLKTMEHGAGAKFHGFHGEIPMLSMLAWDSKNCKITPHESMESME